MADYTDEFVAYLRGKNLQPPYDPEVIKAVSAGWAGDIYKPANSKRGRPRGSRAQQSPNAIRLKEELANVLKGENPTLHDLAAVLEAHGGMTVNEADIRFFGIKRGSGAMAEKHKKHVIEALQILSREERVKKLNGFMKVKDILEQLPSIYRKNDEKSPEPKTLKVNVSKILGDLTHTKIVEREEIHDKAYVYRLLKSPQTL